MYVIKSTARAHQARFIQLLEIRPHPCWESDAAGMLSAKVPSGNWRRHSGQPQPSPMRGYASKDLQRQFRLLPGGLQSVPDTVQPHSVMRSHSRHMQRETLHNRLPVCVHWQKWCRRCGSQYSKPKIKQRESGDGMQDSNLTELSHQHGTEFNF